jgi:acetate---CoA ligase (ADP-forming)
VADDLEAIAALLDDEHVDAALVLHVELGAGDPAARLQALEDATRDASKPVLACVVGAGGELPGRAQWRVPNYRFPEAAVRALALAADRRDWLSRPLGQAPVVDGLDLEAARGLAADAGEGPLEDGRARALLSAVGIEPGAAPDVRMVADPDLGPLIGVGAQWRLAPLTDVDADELASGVPALRDAVVRMAALADAVPTLAAVELDPRAVTLGPAPKRQRAKTW